MREVNPKKKKANKAVIYARISPRPDEDLERNQSIPAQVESCKEYCHLHAIEVIGTFSDEAISGSDILNRKGFKAAMDLAIKEKAALIVYSLSRFARNTKDALACSEALQTSGADLISVTEKIDTTSAMGQFFFTIISALAELERKQIGERTKDALRRKQMNGESVTRPDRPPYGYKRHPVDKARFIECAKEQEIIQRILDLYAMHKNMSWVGRQLEEEGKKARTGKWNAVKINRILKRYGAK